MKSLFTGLGLLIASSSMKKHLSFNKDSDEEISDEEAWNIIVENNELFWFFAHKMQFPKYVIEDIVSEAKMIFFKRLKAGNHLKDNFSKSNMVKWTLIRAGKNTHRDIQSDVKLPVRSYAKKATVYKIVRESADLHDAIRKLKSELFPELSDYDIAVIVFSLTDKLRENVDIGFEEEYWFHRNILNYDTITPQEAMVLDQQHASNLNIFRAIKERLPHPSPKEYRLLYIVTLRNRLEEALVEVYPEMQEMFPLIEKVLSEKEEMLKMQQKDHVNYNPDKPEYRRLVTSPISLREIGDSIGLTRERIRQSEVTAYKWLKKILSLNPGDTLPRVENRGRKKTIFFTQEEQEIILSNTIVEAARILGRSVTTIHNERMRLEQSGRKVNKEVDNRGRKKTIFFTQEDHEIILSHTLAEAARILGCSPATVSNERRRLIESGKQLRKSK